MKVYSAAVSAGYMPVHAGANDSRVSHSSIPRACCATRSLPADVRTLSPSPHAQHFDGGSIAYSFAKPWKNQNYALLDRHDREP